MTTEKRCDHSTGSGKAFALASMALGAALNESVRETWEFWVGSERDLKLLVAEFEANPAVGHGKRQGRVLPQTLRLERGSIVGEVLVSPLPSAT
jgi:hypothetical protein